jgi:hypothetical protein
MESPACVRITKPCSKRVRSHSLRCLVGGLCLLAAPHAFAKDYYVATTGTDSSPGTIDQPFATLQKGVNTAVAGDTVYIRGGTYYVTTPANSGAGITFSKSGTSDTNRIKYWAYPGEVPVFDFSQMTISTTGYTHGFVVSGSWLYFKGLEICNVPMNTSSNNGVAVTSGGYDIFELLNMHHNNGNGIFIGSKSAGGHQILNCDAHDNYDPTSSQGDGQNADGFGVHYQTSGDSTTIRGCRAWWNSDDGYDLINHEVPVIVENSWAMGNGYIKSGTARPGAGNGNGFKMGSSKTGIRHIVRNNVAWKNAATGFYANHSSGGNTWYNNTSYNNGTQYNMLASDPNDSSVKIILTGSLVHIMRNNIGFPNKNTNMEGVDTAFNTWDLGITPAASDFASVDDTGFMGPRQADGSLPNVSFLKLAPQSRMIDKGTDVGLPYSGAAPDLGAYEFGGSAGGTSGTGGATSTGGAAAGGRATGGVSAGGTPSTGGATSTGGRATGGASAGGAPSGGASSITGGATATGGIANTGGSATGGSVVGGTTAAGGSGTGGSGQGTETCSCKLASGTSGERVPGRAVLISMALIGLLRRRRTVRHQNKLCGRRETV